MIPDMSMGMIDVRDVARLHVAAMTAQTAAGQRFIAASAQPIAMATVASILRNAGHSKVPSRRAPSFLVKFMGLFDSQVRAMLPFLGKAASYDTGATYKVLQWTPTPMKTSLTDMAAAIST